MRPPIEDICYATTNRQDAVKAAARDVEAFIVVGAGNSSNSQRLRESPSAKDARRSSSLTRMRSTGGRSKACVRSPSPPARRS